jgi:hypothetical protein
MRSCYTVFNKLVLIYSLPEVPSDTAETNALMRNNDSLPSINELDIKKVQNGFQKLSINFDNDLNELIQSIGASNNNRMAFFLLKGLLY